MVVELLCVADAHGGAFAKIHAGDDKKLRQKIIAVCGQTEPRFTNAGW